MNVNGQQKKFLLPAYATYLPGKLHVKVMEAVTAEFTGSLSSRVRGLPLAAIRPLVHTALAKKGASWRGPLAAKPTIDVGRYFETSFEPSRDIEDVINALYATGYFEIVEPVYTAKIDFAPADPDSSNQYYLKTIRVFEAWDITQGSEDLTIAIVDTGGDLNHPDLAGNLYVNAHEIPGNGIDDDADGYVDNVRGWDFVGADTLNADNPDFHGDNDPSVFSGGQNSHGTWAAGCASASTNNGIGISGVGFKTKLMFTKHSGDNQKTTSGVIYSGFSGILYAANQGIKIINCSWGSSFPSQIDQDMINHVTLDLGCLVVAAAGNSRGSALYPAAYDNVLSVAATDKNNQVASFSYVGSSVDLSAPGVDVFTTSFNDTYATVSGTSFSSPLASGAAALAWSKYPAYTPQQILELLKASADPTALATANPGYDGLLGAGMLDVHAAVTRTLPGLRVSNVKMKNAAGDELQAGGQGFLTMDITNFLQATSAGLIVTVQSDPDNHFISLSHNSFSPGIIQSNQVITTDNNPIAVSLGADTPPYSKAELTFTFSDPGYADSQVITVDINQTPFSVIDYNQVTTSIGASGRMAFENLEFTSSGAGFSFQGRQLVSEIGIILGTSGSDVSNNVRTFDGADEDFHPVTGQQQSMPGLRSDEEVSGTFSNSVTSGDQKIVIGYRSMVWKQAPADKFVVVEFKVKNPTADPITNFYFGMFADWDITPFSDFADWLAVEKTGYIYSAIGADIYAGTQLLTGNPLYYAIENDIQLIDLTDPGDTTFAINDGFTDAEKFRAISSQRLRAGSHAPFGTDVSHTLSSGPFTIKPGDAVTLAYAFHAASDLAGLKASARAADSLYNGKSAETHEELVLAFPNPVQNSLLTVLVNEKAGVPVALTLVNAFGTSFFEAAFQTSDEIIGSQINMSSLPDGFYILKVATGGRVVTKKIVKAP